MFCSLSVDKTKWDFWGQHRSCTNSLWQLFECRCSVLTQIEMRGFLFHWWVKSLTSPRTTPSSSSSSVGQELSLFPLQSLWPLIWDHTPRLSYIHHWTSQWRASNSMRIIYHILCMYGSSVIYFTTYRMDHSVTGNIWTDKASDISSTKACHEQHITIVSTI